MEKCKTCGVLLKKNSSDFCPTCADFHQFRYPKPQRTKVRDEYGRLGK